jgi:tRNA pseudouridine13 synthase
MDRFYSLAHTPIPIHFRQNARDFVVDEIPLYAFSGEGEHLVLLMRKKNLSTWDALSRIANHLGINAREIGYAGLKDKNALTKQYISILKKHEQKLESFEHENIKFIDRTYHNNKIRLGHLKGNRFFIRLKKVTPTAAIKLSEALKQIKKDGMPNFFGYQRFGTDGDNYKLGEEILQGRRKERNVKLKRLYINAYQSHMFNLWLSRRLEINSLVASFKVNELTDVLNMPATVVSALKEQQHPFKVFKGDVMKHYPHGAPFEYEGLDEDMERLMKKEIVPTGLLLGKRSRRASGMAREIEKEFDVDYKQVDGDRRYAWIYPEDVEGQYRENEAWFEMHFSLPKGSYATVLIEELAKRPLQEEGI